jgi:tRNA (guanine6-N2)-methyltransferase
VHEPHLPVLARTLRGIEWIAADEARSRLGLAEIHTGHRELRFRAPLTRRLLELGTVDDIFLVLAEIEGVTRKRDSLARLASVSLDLDAAARLLDRDGERTFDVTASFLGRRNYSRLELEDAVGGAGGWSRVERGGTLSLRVHAAGSVATVAVRVAQVPLHRRAWRVATVPGSLHPPFARALALLANQPFIDPFCGAGTIPIEGALAGLATRGSDADPRAVAAAEANAARARVDVPFAIGDAATLGELNCVVTNPPWGKAVAGSPDALPHAQRIILLSAEAPELEHVVHRQTVRVRGVLATITVAERR